MLRSHSSKRVRCLTWQRKHLKEVAILSTCTAYRSRVARCSHWTRSSGSKLCRQRSKKKNKQCFFCKSHLLVICKINSWALKLSILNCLETMTHFSRGSFLGQRQVLSSTRCLSSWNRRSNKAKNAYLQSWALQLTPTSSNRNKRLKNLVLSTLAPFWIKTDERSPRLNLTKFASRIQFYTIRKVL